MQEFKELKDEIAVLEKELKYDASSPKKLKLMELLKNE